MKRRAMEESKIERAAQQAAQRQAAKIAAKRAYEIAIEQERAIDETTKEAEIWKSTIGNVMFIYLVVGVNEVNGVDLSSACNFIEMKDAVEYAYLLSKSYDTTEIYLNKTDGKLMLLNVDEDYSFT